MKMKLSATTKEAMEQLNILFGGFLKFSEDDMAGYNTCYADVFKKGVNFSFYSVTFFAQFTAELLVGMIAAQDLRDMLVQALDAEKAEIGTPVVFWKDDMNEKRFGIPGEDYKADIKDLYKLLEPTYNKLRSLTEHYGTPLGKIELIMGGIDDKALVDIKRVACEFFYLIRRFDHNKEFAKEVMEWAGCVAKQMMQQNEEE